MAQKSPTHSLISQIDLQNDFQIKFPTSMRQLHLKSLSAEKHHQTDLENLNASPLSQLPCGLSMFSRRTFLDPLEVHMRVFVSQFAFSNVQCGVSGA